MHKLKLLFLVGNYATGGKERQLTEIINHLPRERYEIHLFTKRINSYYFNIIKNNLSSYLSLDIENFSLFDIFKLNKYIDTIQPNVVFTLSKLLSHYALIINKIFSSDYRLINGSIRDASVNLGFHLSSYRQTIPLKCEKPIYNFYKEVVANSKAGLDAYNQTGKKGRHVLYNGFDQGRIPKVSKDELRQQLKIDQRFMIAMAASMGESKDQTTFIRAAHKILLIDNSIQFFLIGNGPKKAQYEGLVESYGITKSVIFTGEVNNVESYLSAADLSVLMSSSWHGAGIPNSVMESMACGTPVIANNSGGTREILDDGVNGFLIKCGDYQSLASKIILLIRDNDLRMKFSINSRNKIQGKFSIKRAIQKFDDIIRINDAGITNKKSGISYE